MKTLLLLLLLVSPCVAQFNPEHKSIHQIESDLHRNDSRNEPALHRSIPAPLQRESALSKRVFGYYPYWSGANDHLSYDFGALTTIGYFSMELDTGSDRWISRRRTERLGDVHLSESPRGSL